MQYTSSIICIFCRQTSGPVRHVSPRARATTGSSTYQGTRQVYQTRVCRFTTSTSDHIRRDVPQKRATKLRQRLFVSNSSKRSEEPRTRVCQADAQSVEVHTLKVHTSRQLPDSRGTLAALRVIRYSDTDSWSPQCRDSPVRRTNGTVEKWFTRSGRLLFNRGRRIATYPTLNRPNHSDRRVSYRYQTGGGHDCAEWPGALSHTVRNRRANRPAERHART